ncbi:L,D-transpeptidase family protein [Pseudobacteriovorax antillogorgiicola]|nr:L,D-transpeptidase family protein [Pseudobacteriovorax antillogorgiicola]
MLVSEFMIKAMTLFVATTAVLAQSLFGASEYPMEAGLEKDIIFLHVDKQSLQAELRTWPESYESSEHLMTLKIAIGKAEGDKQVEGDNKTPEGIYFAQDLIDGRTLPAKYGPFAIPINFPNTFDRHLGKTGYGIWLHGVEKDARIEEAKVTEGCVAFYNADIEALAKWLKPQQTVILISDGRDEVNRPSDIQQVTSLTKGWQKNWAERNLDQYISHYRSNFRFRGNGLQGYREYKGRVFDSYHQMVVNFSNLRVFTHESYALSIMNQDFNGDDRYVSQGRKILYWTKDDSGWKISHEIFENRRFQRQSYSRELFAKLYENSPSAKAFSKKIEESKL